MREVFIVARRPAAKHSPTCIASHSKSNVPILSNRTAKLAFVYSDEHEKPLGRALNRLPVHIDHGALLISIR